MSRSPLKELNKSVLTESRKMGKQSFVTVKLYFNMYNAESNTKLTNRELLHAVNDDTVTYSEQIGELIHKLYDGDFEADEYDIVDSFVVANGSMQIDLLEDFLLNVSAYNKKVNNELKIFTFNETAMILKNISVLIG
jgi:hypothetical protein